MTQHENLDVRTGTAATSCCSAQSQPSAGRHPLDPLDGDEMARAAQIVAAAFGKEELIRFERLEIEEPEKAALRAWKPGNAWERKVRFSIYPAGRIGVTEGILSLTEGRILSSRHLPTARPMIMLEEFLGVESAVKAHPDFIAGCRRRGIENIDMVCVDPWSAGSFGIAGEEERRISHTFAWLRTRKDGNYYAHPIEGLNAVVDVDTMTVLRVDDHFAGSDPLPVPLTESQYDARFQERFAPGGW